MIKCSVICVCSGIGFPHGLAASNRILLIGKALIMSGVDFTVFHIGGSPTDSNSLIKGKYERIKFSNIYQIH